MGTDRQDGGFTCLARDIPGAEGPCFTRDNRILMVGPDEGRVVEVRPGGEIVDVAGTGGIPAGLQVDRNNDVWVADMAKGLLRVASTGRVFTEAAEFQGSPIRGCNDLAFDSKGNLYFTAPGAPVGADPKGRSSLEDPSGEIYCRLRNGELLRLDTGFAFCNGVAVSADDRLLIVAETLTKRLYAYVLKEPGAILDKYVWAALPGSHEGGPDGMDFDAHGNLLVADWGGGGLAKFGSEGTYAGKITTPFTSPSNVHFRGPGSRDLLITEHSTNGLWLFAHDAAGQDQYGWG